MFTGYTASSDSPNIKISVCFNFVVPFLRLRREICDRIFCLSARRRCLRRRSRTRRGRQQIFILGFFMKLAQKTKSNAETGKSPCCVSVNKTQLSPRVNTLSSPKYMYFNKLAAARSLSLSLSCSLYVKIN